VSSLFLFFRSPTDSMCSLHLSIRDLFMLNNSQSMQHGPRQAQASIPSLLALPLLSLSGLLLVIQCPTCPRTCPSGFIPESCPITSTPTSTSASTYFNRHFPRCFRRKSYLEQVQEQHDSLSAHTTATIFFLLPYTI
jgi:hypothetical protein